MLDHISLGVTDLERSRRFYDAALRPLGLVRIVGLQRARATEKAPRAGAPSRSRRAAAGDSRSS